MEITRKENYWLLEDNENDLTGFATKVSQDHTEFEKENVIVNVLNKGNLEINDLLVFLEVSNLHRSHNKSFVIVSNPVSVESLPDDLIIAPTLREAEDIVNMEELERELGFEE